MNTSTLHPILFLKPGRERSLLRRHPWVFSGAIDRIEGDPTPGATVEVHSADGKFLARAAWSPYSQIRARVWTYHPEEPVDEAFFQRRISHAVQRREVMFSAGNNSARLVYAESDGLPGLVVDRYENTLVVQLLTTGVEAWKETIADLLMECTGLINIYERSDADVRELEGLPVRIGSLRGNPPPELMVEENGLKFKVDVTAGHKTGFYLDQRFNREQLRFYTTDKDVLDCFSYTGGFTVNALAGGAKSVLSVDASSSALAICRDNVLLNHLPCDRHSILEGDVFQLLRRFRDEGRNFDVIVLHPPKFAPTSAQAEKAARGYKDINLLAFKLLRPGGLLFTFS